MLYRATRSNRVGQKMEELRGKWGNLHGGFHGKDKTKKAGLVLSSLNNFRGSGVWWLLLVWYLALG